jgi:ornithine--oxo-acid transaminase
VIVEEDLSGRSASLGEHALSRLQSIDSPHVAAVRGKGLWIAIDLNSPARPFCEALKERGVLCKETHDTVIRLAPPLMISREDLDWGLDQIEAVLSSPTSFERTQAGSETETLIPATA